LTIEKSLQDEIVTDSGIKFYIDPTYRKEWQATVVATVAALPIKVSEKNKQVVESLQEGDTVCISYRVVANFSFKGDAHRFVQYTEENPYKKLFINGYGERIEKFALIKIWQNR